MLARTNSSRGAIGFRLGGAFALFALVACGGGGGGGNNGGGGGGGGGGGTTDPVYTLTIDSPSANSTVPTRVIDVTGHLTFTGAGSVAGARVDSFGLTANVAADGSFTISGYPLVDGEDDLALEAFDSNGISLAKSALTIFWHAPYEGSGAIDPASGGTVSVTNAASPIIGASIQLQAGATQSAVNFGFESEPEQTPIPPFGYVAVGAPVTIQPLGTSFATNAQIGVPLDSSLFPAGTDESDVQVFAVVNGEWSTTPLALQGVQPNLATVTLGALDRAPLEPMIKTPLAAGELRVTSKPANATVYLDGVDQHARTPTTLSGVSVATHVVKLQLDTFDELFTNVDELASGTELDAALVRTSGATPVVALDSSIFDGMTVDTNQFEVFGVASFNGVPIPGGTVVFSLNGVDSFSSLDLSGDIDDFVSLLPGDNVLEVRVNAPNGTTGTSPKIHIQNTETTPGAATPPSAISAVLTWNTNFSDLDLHVVDFLGHQASWDNPTGILGGLLALQDDNGYGPELFEMNAPPPGTYHFRVDCYQIWGQIPTIGELKVFVGSTLLFDQTYSFTNDDFDATNGDPVGADPHAFWDAFAFDALDLQVVDTSAGLACSAPIPVQSLSFTTDAAENLVDVRTAALPAIPDNFIDYQVVETVENHAVDTSSIHGRVVQIPVTHRPLHNPIVPRFSHPLTYSIVATSNDGLGNITGTSTPVVVLQDRRSQIRQEFVDKRALFGAQFSIATPSCGEIVDASSFPAAAPFDFDVFAARSDFGPGLTVIGDAYDISVNVMIAWNHPLSIAATWRNPRRNDAFANPDVANHHQSGDAVDLDPSTSPADWPSGVASYAAAQQQLFLTARKTLAVSDYDVFFHGDHIHVEHK